MSDLSLMSSPVASAPRCAIAKCQPARRTAEFERFHLGSNLVEQGINRIAVHKDIVTEMLMHTPIGWELPAPSVPTHCPTVRLLDLVALDKWSSQTLVISDIRLLASQQFSDSAFQQNDCIYHS